MLLDEGKLVEAVSNLRRAYQLAADERTRQLLRESLLEGLRTDFAGYRGRTEEIERLLDDAPQRAAYLRLMAGGLQKAGRPGEALAQYLRLIELDRGERGMEAIDRSLTMRRALWIRAGVDELRRGAPAAAAADIDRVIHERLQAAVEGKSTDALRSFCEYFDGEAAATARRELIRRLLAGRRAMEAEMLLWPDCQSADRAVAGAAVAQLAELLRQVGQPAGAAACYRRLQRQFADVVCRDGKTGKELVAALKPDEPPARLLAAPAAWPRGLVENTVGRPSISAAIPSGVSPCNTRATPARSTPARCSASTRMPRRPTARRRP